MPKAQQQFGFFLSFPTEVSAVPTYVFPPQMKENCSPGRFAPLRFKLWDQLKKEQRKQRGWGKGAEFPFTQITVFIPPSNFIIGQIDSAPRCAEKGGKAYVMQLPATLIKFRAI